MDDCKIIVGLAVRESVSWKDRRWLPKRGLLRITGNDKVLSVAMKASG